MPRTGLRSRTRGLAQLSVDHEVRNPPENNSNYENKNENESESESESSDGYDDIPASKLPGPSSSSASSKRLAAPSADLYARSPKRPHLGPAQNGIILYHKSKSLESGTYLPRSITGHPRASTALTETASRPESTRASSTESVGEGLLSSVNDVFRRRSRPTIQTEPPTYSPSDTEIEEPRGLETGADGRDSLPPSVTQTISADSRDGVPEPSPPTQKRKRGRPRKNPPTQPKPLNNRDAETETLRAELGRSPPENTRHPKGPQQVVVAGPARLVEADVREEERLRRQERARRLQRHLQVRQKAADEAKRAQAKEREKRHHSPATSPQRSVPPAREPVIWSMAEKRILFLRIQASFPLLPDFGDLHGRLNKTVAEITDMTEEILGKMLDIVLVGYSTEERAQEVRKIMRGSHATGQRGSLAR